MAGQVGQGSPEGCRCALASQDRRQGVLLSRRNSAAANRNASSWLQIAYKHRSTMQLYPQSKGHLGGRKRRTPIGSSVRYKQHGCRRMFRYSLSLAEKRAVAGAQYAQQLHPSPQAQRQNHAGAHRQGECGKVSGAGQGRACLCALERKIWSVYSHHRPCASRGQTDACPSRLQLPPHDLP